MPMQCVSRSWVVVALGYSTRRVGFLSPVVAVAVAVAVPWHDSPYELPWRTLLARLCKETSKAFKEHALKDQNVGVLRFF